MTIKEFIEKLRPMATEYAENNKLRIYDITFKQEKEGNILRISLDGDVTLEKCADVSRLVSAWLDEFEELIPYDHYTLEVSSPGGERSLKKIEDFACNIGKMCRITTKTKDASGRSRYKGRITAVSDSSVKIYTEEESQYFELPVVNISKANLEIEI